MSGGHAAPLSGRQLGECFSHVFEVTSECKMFDVFRAAFEGARGRTITAAASDQGVITRC